MPDIAFSGPLRYQDPRGTPTLEPCSATASKWGIYLETVELEPTRFLTAYIGISHGNTIADRINTRIMWDRKNDFRIEADEFVRGRRVWLPNRRALKLTDPADRQQIDKITESLRVFVSPISIDLDYIHSWLGPKSVADPSGYFVKCIENETIRTIRAASERCASFLYNEPKNFKPISVNTIPQGFDIIGLTIGD